ncbi:MAG TPA: hypothetical protein VNF02_02205 [Candidatus Limnocylindrales bacterium]|nr:hypothetical protein [Candidatus Limnocylindrales bacterium]
MTSQVLVIALCCVAATVATLWFVFAIKLDASDFAPHRSRLDQLLERRDAIYENLRDLRFEHRAGKFSEEDYEEMKRALEIEAARVIADMDSLTGGAPTPAIRQAMSEKPRG